MKILCLALLIVSIQCYSQNKFTPGWQDHSPNFAFGQDYSGLNGPTSGSDSTPEPATSALLGGSLVVLAFAIRL